MWSQVNLNSFKSYLGNDVCCIAYFWMRLLGSFFHRFAPDSESSFLKSGYLLRMSECKMSICPIVPIGSPLKEENMLAWDWSTWIPNTASQITCNLFYLTNWPGRIHPSEPEALHFLSSIDLPGHSSAFGEERMQCLRLSWTSASQVLEHWDQGPHWSQFP